MNTYFIPYNYTTNQEIIDHLNDDLKRMIYSICKDGYVCQEQYAKLDAYLCESYASKIVVILSKETGKSIWYAFSPSICYFVFYDMEKLNNDEAIEKVEEFFQYLYD